MMIVAQGLGINFGRAAKTFFSVSVLTYGWDCFLFEADNICGNYSKIYAIQTIGTQMYSKLGTGISQNAEYLHWGF